MTQRRTTIETTLYGKRLVSYPQLMQLHSEVSRAASLARRSDPEYMERYETGTRIAREHTARRQAEWRAGRVV